MKRLGSLMFALAACGGSDADVEGDYTIALTNRDNGCMFQNWTVGEQANGIPVIVTQDDEVSASVEGVAGGILDLALGGHIYKGSVDGNDLLLELFGTRGQQMGNCSFTYNSVIDAEISGDNLTGRIEYTAATNGNPDCSTLEACVSFQEFNGSRAPE